MPYVAADAAKAGFDDSFIYRDLAQELPKRSIPTVQIMRDQSLAVFRAWREKSDKI